MFKPVLIFVLLAGGVSVAAAQDNSLDSLLGPSPAAPASPAPAGNSAAPAPADSAEPGSAATPPAQAPAAVQQSTPVPDMAIGNAPALSGAKSAAKAPSQNRLVEEIVVTAEKREENLQDVPIAISAFSGEKLDALGITAADQLPKITPGLTFSKAAGYPIVYLRGVGSNAFLPSADQDVPFYLDGVNLEGGHGISDTLGRVARVEVLKGPQGTLFGRNSTGGAISIITPDPGPDLSADVSTELGSFGTFNTLFFVNLPIAEGLGATISGFNEQNNTFDQNEAGPTLATYSRGGRLKLLWHATDELSFNASASYGEQSTNVGYTGALTRVAPDFAAIIPPDTDGNYKYSENVVSGSVNNSQLFAGGADWKLPWTELKLIVSDQRLFSPYQAYDYDGSSLPLISFYSTDEFFNQATGEFQILSTPNTPGNDYFSWVAGAYYLEGNGGFPDLILQVAGGAQSAGLLSTIPQLDGFISGVNGLLGGVGLPALAGITGPLSLVSGGLLSSRSLSGYFQGTTHLQQIFNLPQALNLILGARLDRESRGLSDNRLAVENPLSATAQQITLATFSVPKATAVQVPLKAEIQWFPFDGTQIYTAFSRGFTAPTYSTVNFFATPNAVKPEKVNSYEVGAKTQLFDGALTFDTAAFLIDEREILTGFASLTSGGVVEYDNAPRGRINGVEGDFTLQPVPSLDPGLVLLGSASYLHAKYTEYPNGRGYDPTTGLSFGEGSLILAPARNFAGHDIDRTPHFTYNLGINQSIPLNDESRIEIDLATNYSNRYFYDAQNAPQYATKAFQLVDASTSYFYKPWGLEVTGFVTNLTREFYDASSFILDTGIFATPNDPRIIGMRVKYTY